MRSSLADRAGFSVCQADDVVFYLNHLFRRAVGAAEVADGAAAYKDPWRTFDDEALKIVYVDYEMPGPNRFPWTAPPDAEGISGSRNTGSRKPDRRFNPATGDIKEFRVPHMGPALIHSAVRRRTARSG